MAAQLLASGGAVWDCFSSPAQVRGLIDCAHLRSEQGEFQAARIGAGDALQRRRDIRGDLTCWLWEPLYPAERSLLDAVERLRLTLNQQAFLGLLDLELHYAWYPPGAGYARHLDQPRGQQQRKVSIVLYLNESWVPAAGGELRMFGAGKRHHDIEPLAGRLVVFLTAGQEHAVLPTRDWRLSISGWFRSRD
jgi:SM-20-related protein